MRLAGDWVEVDANRQELRAEPSYGEGVDPPQGMSSAERTLTLARIVLRQELRGTCSPAQTDSVSEGDPDPRRALDVSHVTGVAAVLCHDPEGFAHDAVSDWGSSRLAAGPPHRFEQRVSRRNDVESEQQPNRRIEQVLLQDMHGPALHSAMMPCPNRTCTAASIGWL